MTPSGFTSTVLLPIGLGLLGFVEPCSIGSSLVFIKFMEGKGAGPKLVQATMFAVVRALLIGVLGLVAAAIGAAFIGFQKGAWIALGAVYVLIGVGYATGRTGVFRARLGPGLARLSGLQGSAVLGALFGLNIPACAAPLLLALLGTAAAGGASGGMLVAGFASLALFGFALSLPLIIAVLFAPARDALDWLAGRTRRVPVWTGLVLIALGLWSIGFGLFARVGIPG